jgi:thioredoxin-dependent peroxiredoxin
MLATGDQFPDFELNNHEGEARTLSDFAGSWFVVFAFPGAGKSCENQAQGFEATYDDFKGLGIDLLGLAPQSPKKLGNLVKKHELSYPLLSDPDHELLEALEVWGEKKMAGKTVEGVVRSTFLVNPDGEIAEVWENIKVAGHAEAVLEVATEAVNASDEDDDESDEDEEETDELDEEEEEEEEEGDEDDSEDDEESDEDEDESEEETDELEDEEDAEAEEEASDEEEKPRASRKKRRRAT